MTKIRASLILVAACGAVALAGTLNVGCNPVIPFAFDITIPLGTYDFEALEVFLGFAAGEDIPDGFEAPGLPVCNLPTQEDIHDLVLEHVGEFVANLIHLEQMNLISFDMHATQGDFSTITYLSVFWQPKPVDEVEQDPVDLGTADAPSGFGTDIALVPEDPVDFLVLIDNEAANPAPGCAILNMDIDGTVPADIPIWCISATVNVVGQIQF